MWSRIKHRLLAWHRLRRVCNVRISTRLTLLYAAILACVLMFTSIVTAIGVYFSLYHQAEIEMEISVKHIMQEIDSGARFDFRKPLPARAHPGPGMPPEGEETGKKQEFHMDEAKPDFPIEESIMRRDPLMPGVVLRITDEDGQVVFETDSHYPSIEAVEENALKNPPFWANKSMLVSVIKNMHLYYEKLSFEQNGHMYTLHFFKLITAERHFLTMLQEFLLLTNLLGLVIALFAGYFISRRILRPIRTLTKTAQQLEVTDLSRRIEIPPVKDELSELALTFNHMLDRIQLGFEQQRRFVSDASHELRTPVTVIRGYSDMLSRWGRQDEQALDEGISAIRSEAEDMQELIEKLLFLARADQNRQVLHKETFNLADIVGDVAKKIKLIAKTHSVELLRNEDGMVFVDAVTIKQMMRIFLENSLKYTPEGGHLTISSYQLGAEMCLELADDGIGIAKENQKKVFDRFYRVDSSRTKAEGGVGGTGLGLSIARWIAEQHGIRIALESELGKGTKITLYLPIVT